jgi:hypothetical protein
MVCTPIWKLMVLGVPVTVPEPVTVMVAADEELEWPSVSPRKATAAITTAKTIRNTIRTVNAADFLCGEPRWS